jgi:hypothetical protein
MVGTKASSQQITPLNAHNRKTVFRHQMMGAEWIFGDGAHYNEWFPVSQPQEDQAHNGCKRWRRWLLLATKQSTEPDESLGYFAHGLQIWQ